MVQRTKVDDIATLTIKISGGSYAVYIPTIVAKKLRLSVKMRAIVTVENSQVKYEFVREPKTDLYMRLFYAPYSVSVRMLGSGFGLVIPAKIVSQLEFHVGTHLMGQVIDDCFYISKYNSAVFSQLVAERS